MTVREIMTPDPSCCTRDTSLQDVARIMRDEDCGAVPVVDDSDRPVGVVTDRDIVVRLVAEGRDPADARAADAMTDSTVTVRPDDDVDRAAERMKSHQLRRLLVVDGRGACVGIVAQADLARRASEQTTGDVVEDISR